MAHRIQDPQKIPAAIPHRNPDRRIVMVNLHAFSKE
jgi:hypothetical protein